MSAEFERSHNMQRYNKVKESEKPFNKVKLKSKTASFGLLVSCHGRLRV